MFQYLNQPNTAPVAQPAGRQRNYTFHTFLRTDLKTYFTLGNINLANGKVTNLNGYKK